MAIHPSLESMLCESLPELLLVAKYCIEFRKPTDIWPAPGCYGYPAAILLLSIANSIGSYVIGGNNAKRHFKILNDSVYYGLSFTNEELRIIYNNYRNLLAHNTVIATNVGLRIGLPIDEVLQKQDDIYWLNLVPFYNVSAKAVNSFLNNPTSLSNNQTILNIYKKH